MPDIWVLDASAIIQIKLDIPAADQWRVLTALEQLVANGTIAIPREAIREVTEIAHPDAPGVWMQGVAPQLQHPLDPDPQVLRDVLAVAGAVVDPNKTKTDGDPYVLALARELQNDGKEVCVVTKDFQDRPARIAMTTACDLLGIPHRLLEDFLTEVRILPAP